MPNIQLKTGKTIYISCYDYYFRLQEHEIELFFQSCEADDLGIEVDDPFSNRMMFGTLDKENTDDLSDKIIEEPNWDISI